YDNFSLPFNGYWVGSVDCASHVMTPDSFAPMVTSLKVFAPKVQEAAAGVVVWKLKPGPQTTRPPLTLFIVAIVETTLPSPGSGGTNVARNCTPEHSPV